MLSVLALARWSRIEGGDSSTTVLWTQHAPDALDLPVDDEVALLRAGEPTYVAARSTLTGEHLAAYVGA